LCHLLHHPVPASWEDLLRTLHFDRTTWDFSWIVSLHGRDQTRSKTLAVCVMSEIFRNKSLPAGSTNLADYLRGNNAGFQLEGFYLTSAGRSSRTRIKKESYIKGAVVTFDADDRKGIRVLHTHSTNIKEIQITDKGAPPGTLVEYKDMRTKRGLILDKTRHKYPLLDLLFTLFHYGGVKSTADITIQWKP
jgi:hypothetical protein